MKRFQKLSKYGLIGILLVGLLFACHPQIKSNQPRVPDRITIGTTSSIRTLDPADAYDLISGNILFNTTDRLYTYKSGTTELIPQLATDFPKISTDGLTYRIPIRTGVKFHDRTDFNASAMAFSLNRFMELGGAPSSLLTDVVDSIKASSPTELVIKLKQRSQFFPKLLAFTGTAAISPKAYGKKFKPDQIVGTGAYRVAEFVEGSILRLDAFQEYWGKKPENDGIDLQFLSSNANLLNSFKTGGVDVAWQTLSPTQIHNLEVNASKNGWTVASNQGSVILYMVLNVQQPPLDDVRVRQAIAAAINRPLLTERVFQNQRIPIYSLVPKTLSDYKPVFQTLYGDGGNGELARKLLTAAGYSDANPAQVTFWYAPKYAGNGDLVLSTIKAAIARDVGKILQIKLEKVDTTTAYAYLDQGVYPTFFLDWVPDIFDPDNFLQPFLTCDRGNAKGCIKGRSQYQGAFYFNPDMNQLMAQERIEQDLTKRSLLFTKIQEILARDVPFIPLWQNKEYAFARSGIKGVKVEPTQQLAYSTISRS
jgi:peptide/nickel transport system substrate-binding protein